MAICSDQNGGYVLRNIENKEMAGGGGRVMQTLRKESLARRQRSEHNPVFEHHGRLLGSCDAIKDTY